jgi:hypothetical protein
MFEIAQLVTVVPSPDIAHSVRFYQLLGFLVLWMWTDTRDKTEDTNTTQTIVYGGLDEPTELLFNRVTDKNVLEHAAQNSHCRRYTSLLSALFGIGVCASKQQTQANALGQTRVCSVRPS